MLDGQLVRNRNGNAGEVASVLHDDRPSLGLLLEMGRTEGAKVLTLSEPLEPFDMLGAQHSAGVYTNRST